MPDIRSSGVLDDFERSAVGGYAELTSPDGDEVAWVTSPGTFPMRVQDGSVDPSTGGVIASTEFPTAHCCAHYPGRALSGNVEVWAQNAGDAPTAAAWRMGLWMMAEAEGGSKVGYQTLTQNDVGGYSQVLRRYDGDLGTPLASTQVAILGSGDYTMMRLTDTHVEVWIAELENGAPGGVWTRYLNVPDTTYRGPFYAHLGGTDVTVGWNEVGFGLVNRQHIYRWLAA